MLNRPSVPSRPVRPSVHSFIDPSIHSFIRPFIHSTHSSFGMTMTRFLFPFFLLLVGRCVRCPMRMLISWWGRAWTLQISVLYHSTARKEAYRYKEGFNLIGCGWAGLGWVGLAAGGCVRGCSKYLCDITVLSYRKLASKLQFAWVWLGLAGSGWVCKGLVTLG